MFLHAHLPQDRLRALARGEELPNRTTGSALFADISGFTPLTENLYQTLGPRRGAEELSHHLDSVYSALISEVEKYGGSVIGFAGDAITCWFDDALGSQAAFRSVPCALKMQAAMKGFQDIILPNGTTTSLALKVAVATGPARRFIVGNPANQYLDVLAGATVTRTSIGEHLADKGELLLDEATVTFLNTGLILDEWRVDPESGERFALVQSYTQLAPAVEPTSLPKLSTDQLREWLPAAHFERAQSFLTEFRPCTAVFVRFTGIDFDTDAANAQLDTFIRKLQATVARFDGNVLQLTIGDKGSYVHVNFGGINAHEDDVRRAVRAALALKSQSDLQLQIGISQGVMRVGSYGGETRKAFGALGDDVNLSARLMTLATVGEILMSGHAHKEVANDFTFEPRAPLVMKGKAEPLPVFAVTGERTQRAVRLQEPTYALPMVGRQQELDIINDKLELALQGNGQVIGIVAEAGLGKSRLVAEVIRTARRKGFVGYGGACQSDGIHTPYLAWKSIWQAFFEIDPEMSLRTQLRLIKGSIEDRVPSRIEALPLLNAVLDLNIIENEFTKNLEPKNRQSALHALLEDCLKAEAMDEPVLIVIEDLHWIDALSFDLLEQIIKALAKYRVCIVLAYRPLQISSPLMLRLEVLPQFTPLKLHELNREEAEDAIRAKLALLYPARIGTLPSKLVDTLMARSQGNPFYLEELLNYLRDRGLDPLDPADLNLIELPNSLHTLILSRIDQLSEQEKTTLRVASIIGRLFRAKWLTGYYPELGTPSQVKAALDNLDALDITPIDSEPESTYQFKHIVTRQVTYESLSFAMRARLHEKFAQYLESVYPEAITLEALAFHYSHSENIAKQCEYFRRAGETAQKNYANEAALGFYGKLLPLLKGEKEKIEIYLLRGRVFRLMGKFDDAENDYRAALALAKVGTAEMASIQFGLGVISRLRGDHEDAEKWLAQARQAHSTLGDKLGLAQVLVEMGNVLWRKGEYERARETLNQGLLLSREIQHPLRTAQALNSLGLIAMYQGNYAEARMFYKESLILFRKIGNKEGISASINNLGIIADNQGDYETARALYQESASLDREIGDKAGIAASLNNLGILARVQGDYETAQSFYEEGLNLRREMGDKFGIALSLNNLGNVALAQRNYDTAQEFLEESLNLFREMDDKSGIASSLKDLANLALVQSDLIAARRLFEESLALCKEMDEKQTKAFSLLGLGLVGLAENTSEAREYILQSLSLRQETGERLLQTSSLIGISILALHEGNALRAAHWLGAVDSALKALHATMEPDMLPFHTKTLAEVRKKLGATAFQAAWEEGSQWPLEQAVRKVLEEYYI